MPTFRHGKSAKFQLDNAAGTLVDISNVIEEVSLSRSVETAEVTALGNSSKAYIMGLQDGTISVSGRFDATVDAQIQGVIAALAAGSLASASFEYKANSAATSATNPAYTGECFVTSYELSAPVGDVVTFSLDLQITGDVTRATA
jgi:hypothetical protein